MSFEEENRKMMEELNKKIKLKQEEIKDEIVPEAYFYDVEKVDTFKKEIEELKKEYNEIDTIPTKERTEKAIKQFQERLEEIEVELKELYPKEDGRIGYNGGYMQMPEEMKKLLEEKKKLKEMLEEKTINKQTIENIEKLEGEIEKLNDEKEKSFEANKNHPNENVPEKLDGFETKELIDEINRKKKELEELKEKLRARAIKNKEKTVEDKGEEGEIDEEKDSPTPKPSITLTPPIQSTQPISPVLPTQQTSPIPPTPTPTMTNKLPVRSGLQVYRELINKVGYIKGTKAIQAHDWLNKFGLIGKPIAAIIRMTTKRKDEVNRIVEELDEIQENNPRDFELLMDDFLLKDNDTINVMKYKVNEILLLGIEEKLKKETKEKEPILKQYEQQLAENCDEVEEQLRGGATGEEVIKLEERLIMASNMKAEVHKKRQLIGSRPGKIKDAREDKSYDRKDNIKGKSKAVRNPDNRQEINELADIELKKLEAQRNGDALKVAKAREEMSEYAGSKTEHIYKRNGKIKASVGKFEAEKGEIQLISHERNMTPELLHAAMLAAGISGVQLVNFLNQNGGIKSVAQSTQTQIEALKNGITNQDIVAGKGSLNAQAAQIQITGERTSNFLGQFDTSSATYQTADLTGVTRATEAAKEASKFTPTGTSNVSKLASIFNKLAQQHSNYAASANQELSNAASTFYGSINPGTSGGVDHTLTAMIEQALASNTSGQATLYSDIAKVLGSIDKLDTTQLNALANNGLDLKPLLLTLVPTASRVTSDKLENNQKRVKEIKQEQEEQQENEDGR